MALYPGEMATELRLPDGTRAITWSLLPDDKEALAEGYDQLDAESKYHRFLHVVPHLNEEMLHHLVDEVDGVNHIALVLFVIDDRGRGEPAGIARLERYLEEPDTADVAVTVLPEYRGRGVASSLLEVLVAQRPPGVVRVRTQVLADNVASLRMLERLGPATVKGEGPVLEVQIELPQHAVSR